MKDGHRPRDQVQRALANATREERGQMLLALARLLAESGYHYRANSGRPHWIDWLWQWRGECLNESARDHVPNH